MNGALRQAAHPQHPFFQFIQVLFEMTFHGCLPDCILAAIQNQSSTKLFRPPIIQSAR
jgi:hypothetical protein